MRSFPKTLALLAAAALGLSAGAFAKKKPEEPSKKESAKKGAKPDKKNVPKTGDDADSGTRKAFDMVPKDHDAKGLKIPYFDGTGKLQMIFTIGVASRLDEEHLNMFDMQIETFDGDGEREMMIDLPKSILDVNTNVISTKKHVTIRRDDFELTGETMEFNMKTKQGGLGGGVRMLIYDLREEAGTPMDAPAERETAPTSEPKTP